MAHYVENFAFVRDVVSQPHCGNAGSLGKVQENFENLMGTKITDLTSHLVVY